MEAKRLGDAAGSPPSENEGLREASRVVFERSRMAFVIVDDGLAIVDANESAATLTGYTRTVLKTMHATDMWLPAERLQAAALWERAMRAGTLVGSRRLLTKDGGTVPVRYSVKSQIAPNRNLVVWVPSLRRIPAHPEEEIVIESEERTPISRREAQVVTLLALGETGEDAAVSLGISPETVRTHVRNAMAKAHARTRAHLVAIALHRGWIVSTD